MWGSAWIPLSFAVHKGGLPDGFRCVRPGPSPPRHRGDGPGASSTPRLGGPEWAGWVGAFHWRPRCEGRAAAQRQGRMRPCGPCRGRAGRRDRASGPRHHCPTPQPASCPTKPTSPREGRHSEPLCLGRRREFLMKRSGPQATRGSAKTILDKAALSKLRRLPTPAEGGHHCCHDEMEGPVGPSALPPSEAAAHTSARPRGTEGFTGAPTQRACWSAATRCAGAAFARGEPAGASDGVGRRAGGQGRRELLGGLQQQKVPAYPGP